MPRGGPRPGAGAPIGNTNAFRHGRSYLETRALAHALFAIPAFRRYHLALVRAQSKNRAVFEAKCREILENNRTPRLSIDGCPFYLALDNQKTRALVEALCPFARQHNLKGGD